MISSVPVQAHKAIMRVHGLQSFVGFVARVSSALSEYNLAHQSNILLGQLHS